MAVEVTDLATPMVHVVTLVITGTSAVYVIRQKTSEYLQVRNLLVMVHVFYMGVVSFEFARTFVPATSNPLSAFTQFFLRVYTISNTTFVLVDVFLLTLVAVAIYYRPNGRRLVDILREVTNHQMGATVLLLFGVYIAVAEGYLLVVPSAFSAQVLLSITGNSVVATSFDPLYLDMLLGILLVFIAYPSTLLILARRRTTDGQVRRAFAILPIAWIGIGIDLLIFNGYLLNQGIDASAIGYLFAAAAFAATASTFRRATLLSSFFLPVATHVPSISPTSTFSGRLGLETGRILGKTFLLEINPAVRYEESVKDLASELGSQQNVVFAFTSKGSPVYNSLVGLDNVRFFVMTTKVSYPKPGETPTEVLVPSTDMSVLLSVLDKAITSNPDLKFGVIFDSITDLILSSGLEVTYKFLKQANEMVSHHGVTAVFLMTLGAHTEREINIVRSLYGNLLSYGTGQLAVQKTG